VKGIVKKIIAQRFSEIREELNITETPFYEVEKPKNRSYGDYSTNLAMTTAKLLRKNPREIANAFIKNFNHPLFEKIEIAGAGFINFFINQKELLNLLNNISQDFDTFLSPKDLTKKKLHLEYVSANPTGPLHVGHGRGACIGSSLALILKEVGHDVKQEFYINDAGSQIKNLGLSILLRAKELKEETVEFPEGCYLGEYVSELAKDYIKNGGSDDIDDENIEKASVFGTEVVLDWIKNDLKDFGVEFDSYFSERSLFVSGFVAKTLDAIKEKNLSYEKDGALWFRTTDFGDDKDRVLVKENKETTYFASDIAYHKNKFEQKFDEYINIWGADHHGYVPRIKSAIKALGHDEEKLKVLMVQMVSLFRDGKPVTMSKRSGEFITLRDVLDEVGRDAMRFMFLTRRHDSPLDFDIELVKQKTSDNPVFYVQYMYARINSVFNVAKERNIDITKLRLDFSCLMLEEEKQLIDQILSFPDVVLDAAEHLEPHILAYYLINMAQMFHSYYNAHRFICEDSLELTVSRLSLLKLLQKTVKKGLLLLGIESPERM